MKNLQEILEESMCINEMKLDANNIKKTILKYNPKINKSLLADAIDAYVTSYRNEGMLGDAMSQDELEDDLAQMADAASIDNYYYLMNAAITPDFFDDYFDGISQGDEKIDEIEDLIKKYNVKH